MEHGKRYRLKKTGEIGRLEGPPLYDPGDVQKLGPEETK